MNISRVDYVQVPGTNRGVLALLPQGDREPLAVGDQAGTLSLFRLDPISTTDIWKQVLRPITHLELGRRVQSSAPTETIYASSGCCIQSFSNGGREVSNFDTNIAENLKSFKIQESDIWAGGKYIYSHFVNERDIDYIIFEDLINDLALCKVSGDLVTNAVLAFNDKTIRVLDGSKVKYSQVLSSSPTVLSNYNQRANDFSHTRSLLYGTSSGSIGLVNLERERSNLLWNIDMEGKEINCISSYDMTGDGFKDVLVGRNDGKIEIYSFDQSSGELLLNSSLNVSEGVTSLAAGKPRGSPEILVSTYSGKIIGVGESNMPIGTGASVIEGLQGEITLLKHQVDMAKRESVTSFPGQTSGTTAKVSNTLSLIGDEACYLLTIQSQEPIGLICLQSEVPLDLIEDENSKVIHNVQDEGQILMTFRFPDSSFTHFEMKFRSTEGQSGDIQLYIIPTLEPKIAQLLKFDLKPLSLHEKVSAIPEEGHPLNNLQITGSFTKNDMHGWVSHTLPDVPPHTTENNVTLYYTNCILHTVLIVKYTANFAEFKSDSVSVIAIIKESISKHASFKKIQLDIRYIEEPASHEYVLRLIDQQLSVLQDLETRNQLLDALREISNQGDLEKFSEEFQGVLTESESIQNEYKKRPKKLQFLQGVISDLYVDKSKFRGIHSVSGRIQQLQQILANYDIEALIEFFKE
ncbi:unnamed protein product [Blepharisma stoltei]|uniref:Bardet-Biedl syndrome 7 n=1 Tax=Blepharisma stoltei TaxID=1481888 RepID=A0AAU9KAQ9_9CILI|nr:unnamed protein product [Blepharisma stoltei]